MNSPKSKLKTKYAVSGRVRVTRFMGHLGVRLFGLSSSRPRVIRFPAPGHLGFWVVRVSGRVRVSLTFFRSTGSGRVGLSPGTRVGSGSGRVGSGSGRSDFP